MLLPASAIAHRGDTISAKDVLHRVLPKSNRLFQAKLSPKLSEDLLRLDECNV
jgi:hypothetical protein